VHPLATFGGVNIGFMAKEQTVPELLAAGDEALAEAGFRTGDFGAARKLFEAAQADAASGNDPSERASAAAWLGMLRHYENITNMMSGAELSSADIDAEEKLFRQALAYWQDSGDATASAQSLFGLGLVFQVLRSDWMTAMPYFWQALGLISAPDAGADVYLRSEVHRHVGFYYLVEDIQPGEAVRHLQISLELREELADARRIPSGRVALARAELAAGNRQRAIELLRQAVTEARAAALLQARIEEAEQALREAEDQGDDTAEQRDQPTEQRDEPTEQGDDAADQHDDAADQHDETADQHDEPAEQGDATEHGDETAESPG
jgi:tetratricopeptide (TPR) repeat protein